jgi:hypothetical protein
MAFLERLRRARAQGTSAFVSFVNEYKRGSKIIHVFVEGDDDESFYVSFLYAAAPADCSIRLYRCGNRAGVMYVYNKLDWTRYERQWSVFFIDRDYSSLLGEIPVSGENLFITQWYSVENYLVAPETFLRCLRELLHITPDADGEEELIKRFNTALGDFHRAMLPVSALLIAMRKAGRSPQYENLDPLDLIAIDEELRCRRTQKSALSCRRLIEHSVGVAASPDVIRLAKSVARDLVSMNPKEYCRGKYELRFFVQYLAKVVELADLAREGGDRSKKLSTQIHMGNAVEVIGPRAQLPNDLEEFFRSLWSEIRLSA